MVQALVLHTATSGTLAALEVALFRIDGLADFNVKEYLWHVILLDEFVWKQPSQMRVRFEAQTLWGPGGLIGLRIFFPILTKAQVAEAAKILSADLQARGVLVLGMHFLQWTLCLWQKSLNPGYSRRIAWTADGKLPWQVGAWSQLLRHPFWPSLRAHMISLGLEDAVCVFECSVRTLAPATPDWNWTCRSCLNLGVCKKELKSHKYWIASGYICKRGTEDEEQRTDKKQKTIASFFAPRSGGSSSDA